MSNRRSTVCVRQQSHAILKAEATRRGVSMCSLVSALIENAWGSTHSPSSPKTDDAQVDIELDFDELKRRRDCGVSTT